MSDEFKQVPVYILGKEYLVACKSHEHEELIRSARMLDGKMREIRDSGKVIGTERIAVMAALNMAHELLNAGAGGDDEAARIRLRALQSRIELVLAGEDDRQLKL